MSQEADVGFEVDVRSVGDAVTARRSGTAVLGAGTPLFSDEARRTGLTQRSIVRTPTATHLTYDLARGAA